MCVLKTVYPTQFFGGTSHLSMANNQTLKTQPALKSLFPVCCHIHTFESLERMNCMSFVAKCAPQLCWLSKLDSLPLWHCSFSLLPALCVKVFDFCGKLLPLLLELPNTCSMHSMASEAATAYSASKLTNLKVTSLS